MEVKLSKLVLLGSRLALRSLQVLALSRVLHFKPADMLRLRGLVTNLSRVLSIVLCHPADFVRLSI